MPDRGSTLAVARPVSVEEVEQAEGEQHGGSEHSASVLERSWKGTAVETLQDAADQRGDDTEKDGDRREQDTDGT
ncbi:hypothetical protein [Actinomadura algeriensis]|uniref:Uncharacterized protein n=1 Tax=Actinomadura algeriensis TaxID=1679523 RepID=A0ABR9K2H0_9ACTN|nr:hypothetical protein [Actinomadura algeriensis]MBE1537023.1 hypothetical protein [Actinomadura algeriensis]